MKMKRVKPIIELSIENFLKKLRFDSMADGKKIIRKLLDIDNEKKFIEVNDLLTLLGKDQIPDWQGWGWNDLLWDMLSNKYGAAFRKRGDDTYFVLQLPPVKLCQTKRKEKFDPLMGIFTKKCIGEIVKIDFDPMHDSSFSVNIVYKDQFRTYEVVYFSMLAEDLKIELSVAGCCIYAEFAWLGDNVYKLTNFAVMGEAKNEWLF